MIDALGLLIREGFGLVIASVLPLFVIAAAAASMIGLLGGALGIRDAALGQIVRALAVLLALGLVIESVTTATVEFAARSWSLADP
jgi:type III secretory pathway component EscS